MKHAVLFGLLALAGGFVGALVMKATVAGQGQQVLIGSDQAIRFDATNILAGPEDIRVDHRSACEVRVNGVDPSF